MHWIEKRMTNFSLARRALSPCKVWRRSCNARRLQVRKCGVCYRQDCRQASNTAVLILLNAKNQVFRPSGATRCTDTGQTLHCRRVPGSAWLCKILPKSAQRCGNAAQKYQKFPLFGKQWPSTGEPLDRLLKTAQSTFILNALFCKTIRSQQLAYQFTDSNTDMFERENILYGRYVLLMITAWLKVCNVLNACLF